MSLVDEISWVSNIYKSETRLSSVFNKTDKEGHYLGRILMHFKERYEKWRMFDLTIFLGYIFVDPLAVWNTLISKTHLFDMVYSFDEGLQYKQMKLIPLNQKQVEVRLYL